MRSLVGQFPVKSLWKPWQQRVAPDNHHVAVQSLQSKAWIGKRLSPTPSIQTKMNTHRSDVHITLTG